MSFYLFASRTLFASLLAIICIGTTASAQTAPTKLEVGKSIERTLGPGQSHIYTITLGEKQYLQFVVEQHGVDVVVQVLSPSGQAIARIDSPNGMEGPEHGSILSAAGGIYTIIVSPLDQSAELNTIKITGRYEIKTIELRDATDDELKVGLNEEYRKKKAMALLSEVLESLPNIHQTQTRVRIKEQAAQLLWKSDEKRAAKLLAETIKDAQDYVQSFPLDAENYYEASGWAQQVRFEVVQLLAMHDPEAALELLISTRMQDGTQNEQNVRTFEEAQFELSLASQIAEKNPQRAYELAETSLQRGYSPTLLQTLGQLRKTNQDLGTKLSKSLTTKLLSESFLGNPQAMEMLLTILRSSQPARSGAGGSSVLPEQILSPEDTKELVRKALNEAMNYKPAATEQMRAQSQMAQSLLYSMRSLTNLNLDEFVPGSTAAIDKKLAQSGLYPNSAAGEWSKYEEAMNNPATDALATIGQAPDYLREQLVRRYAQKTASSGNLSQATEIVNENVKDPRERQQVLLQLEREAAMTDANQGNWDEALKHVAKLPSATARAAVISEIADRIGKGQKSSKAIQLLETARTLVGASLRPEGSEQMIALLKLAGAFAHYDSKRALEIVQPLVEHFNELAEAARVLNGFGPDYFENGELLMHNGNSLTTIAVPLADALGEISVIDFDKTKQVSERIALPEVRLSLYLGMIQQVIAPGELNVGMQTMYMSRRID
jgi:hypothetical protein